MTLFYQPLAVFWNEVERRILGRVQEALAETTQSLRLPQNLHRTNSNSILNASSVRTREAEKLIRLCLAIVKRV